MTSPSVRDEMDFSRLRRSKFSNERSFLRCRGATVRWLKRNAGAHPVCRVATVCWLPARSGGFKQIKLDKLLKFCGYITQMYLHKMAKIVILIIMMISCNTNKPKQQTGFIQELHPLMRQKIDSTIKPISA